ncbi:MAG TPA: hypothetical protein VII06_27765 [Chloroflexota bacterium]
MANLIARCGRCNGQMTKGYDGDLTCLWCGEVVYLPPPPLYTGDDIEAWRTSMRGKPGRPRRTPAPDAA